MEKFSRTYKINFFFGTYENGVITMNDTFTSVEYPLTLEMSINRNISNVMNIASLVIYGLDETKRKLLAKDRNNQRKYIRMDIYGGYNGNQWLIYRGAILECYSVRDGGETEFKTYIDSADTAMELFLGSDSKSFENGVDAITQINNIGASMLDLHIGAISDGVSFTRPARGQNFTGNPLKLLRNIGIINTNDGQESTMCSDLGEVYFLRPDRDYIKKFGILQIDDSFGLLGTPRRRDTIISVKMIFEPSANLNQLCVLESKTLGIWGKYKVLGVSHNGIISGAKNGALVTTIDLFLGTDEFYGV